VIGSLRGVVLDRTAGAVSGEVLLEVGGVGYRCTVTTGTLALAELASPLFVHVHTHVREDAIILYGFATREERACFEVLITVHGVGPSLALALLSTHHPVALRRIVLGDDADALTLVPGVGKKTAIRLLLELKAKLDLDVFDDGGLSIVGAGPSGEPLGTPSPRAEARAALAGLGYGADEVRDALRDLPDEGDAAGLVRLALRQLAGIR
jgi:Holliday junction DNA helicase RuvA